MKTIAKREDFEILFKLTDDTKEPLYIIDSPYFMGKRGRNLNSLWVQALRTLDKLAEVREATVTVRFGSACKVDASLPTLAHNVVSKIDLYTSYTYYRTPLKLQRQLVQIANLAAVQLGGDFRLCPLSWVRNHSLPHFCDSWPRLNLAQDAIGDRIPEASEFFIPANPDEVIYNLEASCAIYDRSGQLVYVRRVATDDEVWDQRCGVPKGHFVIHPEFRGKGLSKLFNLAAYFHQLRTAPQLRLGAQIRTDNLASIKSCVELLAMQRVGLENVYNFKLSDIDRLALERY